MWMDELQPPLLFFSLSVLLADLHVLCTMDTPSKTKVQILLRYQYIPRYSLNLFSLLEVGAHSRISNSLPKPNMGLQGTNLNLELATKPLVFTISSSICNVWTNGNILHEDSTKLSKQSSVSITLLSQRDVADMRRRLQSAIVKLEFQVKIGLKEQPMI